MQKLGRGQTVFWIIAVLLAFIGGALWQRGDRSLLSSALAQGTPAGARGVFAFTGQIDEAAYGLFMIDIEQGTVWCYEIENQGGVRQLRLAAARTWIYDRYLRDFNCAQPDFRKVQELVAKQRVQPTSAEAETPRRIENPDKP